MKRLFVFGLLLAALLMATVACGSPTPAVERPSPEVTVEPTPTVEPMAVPEALPEHDDIDVLISSPHIPDCLPKENEFQLIVDVTFRGETTTQVLDYAWRPSQVTGSPGVEVLNIGQELKFEMLPTEVAEIEVGVMILEGDGSFVFFGTKIPVFRFDLIDGQGRACFEWARDPKFQVPFEDLQMKHL